MTTLGELLEQLQDRSQVYQLLTKSRELQVISALDKLADELGDEPGNIALRAVKAFTTQADDEAWVKLISRMQNSPSPAGACLGEMIAWAMKS